MTISVISAILKNKFAGVFLGLVLVASCVALPDLVAEAAIDFTQCRNDPNNDNVIDNCAWTDGGINSNNGFYSEGDAVPQRLFITIDTAGLHTLRFTYDFTKASIYAYDFLTSATEPPQGVAFLNECANLPSFVDLATCNTLFAGTAPIAIPSDTFDAVAARETLLRKFLIDCDPNCTSIGPLSFPAPAHNPSTNCFQNCGTSSVSIDLAFTTASDNTLMAIWFGGHLSRGGVAADEWGTGFGASSISGAPFAISLVSLDGGSVGNRTNQLQGGVFAAPTAGAITVQKVVIGTPPGTDWDFGGDLGAFTLPAVGGQQTFTSLDPGSYTISETTKPGFTASVGCSDGTVGFNDHEVTVTLDDAGISCIFTNTAPPTSIPTLSEWGMIGMALLLAAVALWYLRSRSVLRT